MALSPRSALVAVLALGLTLLTGCGGADPVTAPTAQPSSATPTPTAAAAPSAPEPVIDLTCDDLATGSLATLLPAEADRVARDGGARVTNNGAGPAAQYSLRSLGGLACEWSNGLTRSPDGTITLVGVEVMILPEGTSQYERWIAGYLDGSPSCRGEPVYCDSNELIGTTWVSITATATTGEGFADYAAEVRDRVTNAGSGAAPWVPETTLGPGGCGGIIADAAMSTALGIDLLGGPPHAGGWSIQAAADANFGTLQCIWYARDSDHPVSFLAALPGGAWAWKEAAPDLTNPSVPVALDVPGLAAEDEAWIRCTDLAAPCIVDLILGNDWIEFRVWNEDQVNVPVVEPRTGAVAIATAIVAGRP